MVSVVGQVCGKYLEIKKFRVRVYHIHGCPDAYIMTNTELNTRDRVADKDLPLISYDIGLETSCELGDFVHILCPTGNFDSSVRAIGKVWDADELADELKVLVPSYNKIPVPSEEQEAEDNSREPQTCETGSSMAGDTAGTSTVYDDNFKTFFGYPFASYYNVSCEWHQYPTSIHPNGHLGIDIAVDLNTPVYAAGSGTVCAVCSNYPVYNVSPSTPGYTPQVTASDRTSYGNYVTIYHGQGPDGNHYFTHYAHLSSTCVNVGDTVQGTQLDEHGNKQTGTKIGQIDNTGHSYGNHLHFEVLVDNSGNLTWHNFTTTRNPRVYIKFDPVN